MVQFQYNLLQLLEVEPHNLKFFIFLGLLNRVKALLKIRAKNYHIKLRSQRPVVNLFRLILNLILSPTDHFFYKINPWMAKLYSYLLILINVIIHMQNSNSTRNKLDNISNQNLVFKHLILVRFIIIRVKIYQFRPISQ